MTAIDTPEHVALSVAAAAEALDQLEHSLVHGGFAEGAAAYQRMSEVLVAQRLFHAAAAQEAGALVEDPLEQSFDRLGDTARRVFELLEPYVVAMRRLAALAPERVDQRAERAVLDQLDRRGARGATVSVLARASRLPSAQVEQVLAGLVDRGLAAQRSTSGRASYRRAEPASVRTSR